VLWASEKWGGGAHYRGEIRLLGTDDFGAWIWRDAGVAIYRGTELFGHSEFPVVALVPERDWWSLSWWIGHGEVELYVNINTPSVWVDDELRSVDLDLDVIRWLDGRVEVVDRDEFELHQVAYGYPPDLIEATERAAAQAYELTNRAVPPFDGAAARDWAARAAT
jgi:protein associated with RNAse G/E